MRILLDTNILIHREARTVVRDDIGPLFRWLDRMNHEKCVHPRSLEEIRKHVDKEVVRTFETKLSSYSVLKTTASDTPEIASVRAKDQTENERIDTSIVAEVVVGKVDLLISEDRGVHHKANILGAGPRVFTIDGFLEKMSAENPDLREYEVLSVRQSLFGNINLSDPFFDSFKEQYLGFEEWFQRKSDETAYVCYAENGRLLAFLYVKREDPGEDYSDISPIFQRARRLKIGTFKVIHNGQKIGERFLKIVFDNAFQYGVDEIYVTIFENTFEQRRLTALLQDWGFRHHGRKISSSGEEQVFVRDFRPLADRGHPALTFPYVSREANKYIVSIYPEYHTDLFPDSILTTESPREYVENRPHRNAISKVFISRSFERGLVSGDIIVFYRTRSGGSGYHTSVVSTLGIVQSVVTDIKTEREFIEACRKRSVFSDSELASHWNYNRRYRPFVVNFLYVHSFPTPLPNLKTLMDEGIIAEAPRGFDQLSNDQFQRLLEVARADQRLVID